MSPSFTLRPVLHGAGPRFVNLKKKSLLRADVASLSSLGLAFLLSHFPTIRANPFVAVPLLLAVLGTMDAARCMQPQWNFYHGAVILSLYMDILILTLILFFLLWPYFHWFL